MISKTPSSAHVIAPTFLKTKINLSLVLCGLGVASTLHADEIALSSLDLGKMNQDYGSPQVDKSVSGNPLTIHGTVFPKGVGTHANSTFLVDLHQQAQHFHAMVGVDDDAGNPGAQVRFKIYGDDKLLWTSDNLNSGHAAQAVDLDLPGIHTLKLQAAAGGPTIDYDHADWAGAIITYSGAVPVALDPPLPPGDPGILTPAPPDTPRINGPKIFGVHPDAPFLYTIPATGRRPVTYSADNLPEGLQLDADSGQITGHISQAGHFSVTLHARNDLGTADKPFEIVVGDEICLTPPMGWNSWNCWGGLVSQDKVLTSAKAMVSKGLSQHGWTYVNIDDGWQGVRGGEFNAIQPNKKFTDMKALADQIHAMGLHFGIYSTPWQGTYANHIGSSCPNEDGTYDWIKQGHHDEFDQYVGGDSHWNTGKYPFIKQDAKQWAAWGVDYLKYDWRPIDLSNVQAMTEAIRASGRDMVYSLSNNASFENGDGYARLSNLWRTSKDITDDWTSMTGEVSEALKWSQFCGPGHYNDPDMLIVGRVGWGNPQPTHLTHDEQYTHISFWCLLNAPLLIGCDLGRLDDFTLNLLTNDEVLAIDQDSLCKPASLVKREGAGTVYAKTLADGSLAVGLFNPETTSQTVPVRWSDLGLQGAQKVRDLWRQKDLGTLSDKFEAPVDPHGVLLLKISSGS